MAEILKDDFIKTIVENITNELDAKRVTRQGATQSQGTDMYNVANLTLIVSAVIKGLMPVIRDTIKSAMQEEKIDAPDVNKDIVKLRIELDNANQYSRKDSCRISGLPEDSDDGGQETNDSLVRKVVELGEKTGANITDKDISVTHRLPTKIHGVRQTIVKFTSRRAKESFYRSKKKLKDLPACNHIYITEDLTQMRYKLLQQCKQCVGFSSLTTSNTKILVWRDGHDAPVHITQPEDLSKLGMIPDYKALGLI